MLIQQRVSPTSSIILLILNSKDLGEDFLASFYWWEISLLKLIMFSKRKNVDFFQICKSGYCDQSVAGNFKSPLGKRWF